MRPNDGIRGLVNYARRLREQAASRGEVLAVVVALLAVVVVSAITLPALASAEGDMAAQQPEATQPEDSQAPVPRDEDAGQQPAYQTGELTYQSQDAQDDEAHYTVTATVDESAQLPQGTTLKVSEMRQDKDEDKQSYDDHRKAALAELQRQDAKISGFGALRLFDVRFVDANGNEVQPAADVTVKVSTNTALEAQDAADVKVVGFQNDDDPTTDISVVDKDKVQAQLEDGKTNDVTFTVGKGCVYAVGTVQRDQTITAEDDSYKVTLSYDGTAKLPEGVTASVSDVADDSDQYNSAKDAVVAEKKSQDQDFDESAMGMAALDITLHDKDGNEVEPDANGRVGVRIEAKSLPQGADDASLEVQHVEEGADQATTVASDVKADGTSATAEFDVSGFSVFTITWTTTNGNTTSNIGNVTMHYVNENGLEIDRTATLGDGDLSKTDGQVVKIADWVNDDSQGNRKVSGYRYTRATIGSFAGAEITAVKVQSSQDENGKTTYKLYYTDSSAPDDNGTKWDLFQDSVSKNDSNNADIYLVFHSTAQSVNVHFVDEDGNIIINPIYHYANETYEKFPNGFNIKLSDKKTNPWYEPIQNYEFTGRVHVGEIGWQGFAFSKIKANMVGDNYHYQYCRDNNSNDWTDLTATDVYLIYKKASYQIPVTIKYIDSTGQEMKDEAGNSLDRTVDAADWTSGQWQNIQGYSESVNGYTINQDSIFVAKDGQLNYSGMQHKESNTKLDTKTVGDYSGASGRYLRIVTDQTTKTSIFQIGLGYDITGTGNVGGSKFSGSKTDKTAPDSKINRYWDINGSFTIYLVYDRDDSGKTYSYTIHYVDGNGNNIPGESASTATFTDNKYIVGDTFTVDLTGESSGTGRPDNKSENPISFSKNIDKTINGYTKVGQGYLGRPTAAEGGLPFTSILFEKTGINQWKYYIYNNDETSSGTAPADKDMKELNLSNLNFNVVYEKTEDTTDTGRKVTIHFVDTDGNDISHNGATPPEKTWKTRITLNKNGKGVDNGDKDLTTWQGWDFTKTEGEQSFNGSSTFINNIPSGYTFVGEYIGPSFNMDANKLVTKTAPNTSGSNSCVQWTYRNGKWYVSYNKASSSADTSKNTDGSDKTVFEGYVTDIYWVYAKTSLTVHYVKLNSDNSLTAIKGQANKTASSLGTKEKPVSLTGSEYVPEVTDLSYIGTRLGPSSVSNVSDLGPDARNVYLDNGKRIYYFENSTPYSMAKQGNNDMWLYAAPTGRRFTLRKTSNTSSGNTAESYTIDDSQHGTLALSMSAEGTAEGTYTATFHGETETTEYTVVKGRDESGGDTYSLTVHNYLTSNLDDVYEIYRDDSNNDAAISINNDLQYSGYLVSDLNSWLTTRMSAAYDKEDKITDYFYSWNKITTGDGIDGEKNTEVVRAQNGPHWNIAYNRKERTSLDVEADNGGRNDTDQKTVNYTVTFHYKIGDGAWKTVTSPRCSIDYYSQLMNGDFEKPNKVDDPPQSAIDGTGFYENSEYKGLNGIWQTTASDNYIEIVNTNQAAGASYDWNNSLPFAAAHGSQFAELNANRAGALYQDVVTHPNTYLNYWFSHRARGKWPNPGGQYDQDKKAIPEYDTMYLVIMPTKLAMTGANGGELKTQTQLSDFINAHGGFDTDKATAVGQEITYRNDTDGILIEKVSSNDQFWHNVNVPNGYVAKGGLTRFFFVAGPQAYDEQPGSENTHGNFIDNVGFNQVLPPPDGFHLTVSKTFSGLSKEQIAGLVNGNNKFQITLNDEYSDPETGMNSTSTSTPANSTLNGARLSFTVNNDGSVIPFTATAVDSSGNNLLTGSNSGNVKLNDDGSVTMTWTFLNQALDSDKHDQEFNYFANESNATVTDYTLNADKQISTTNTTEQGTTVTGGENSNEPGAAIVKQGTDATFTLSNTYRSYQESDQPRIVVSKTFYGLTPSGVDEMFSDGYQMTVTKQASEEQRRPSETLTTNNAALDPNVSYTTSQDDSHNTTVRWVISGNDWTDGKYDITETNYSTSDYKVTQVKVNGDEVNIQTEPPTANPSTSLTKENIPVGSAAGGVTLSSDTEDVKAVSAKEGDSLTTVEDIPGGTNFVAVQYTVSGTTNYLVWTATSIGRNVSEAILQKINTPTSSDGGGVGWTGDAPASFSNTIFRSGEAGAIATSGGSISFDHTTGTMTFSANEGSDLQWKKVYATKISGETQADIRVENSYNPVVRIQKVNSTDTDKTLSGAEFKLFKMEAGSEGGTATKSYYKADASGAESWVADASDGDTFTTGADGTVNLPGLSAGTYFIEETKAPDGYNRLAKPIAFTVTNNDSVTQTKSEELDGIDATTPIPDWNHPFYTITVSNTAGSILPNTGGNGVWSYVLTGLALVMLGAYWLFMRRTHDSAQV